MYTKINNYMLEVLESIMNYEIYFKINPGNLSNLFYYWFI